MLLFFSPAENKRLESELEKLKTEIEEQKNESQHFEEIKRLRKCAKLEGYKSSWPPNVSWYKMKWVVQALIKGRTAPLIIIASHALMLYSLQKWLDLLNVAFTFHV